MPGGSPAAPAASHVDVPWRIGDSIVHPEIDGIPVEPAEDYARAFVAYLQEQPALQELLDGWVSSRALERRYYPKFIAGISNRIPYRTTAIALGKITEKRERQMMLTRRGKSRRRTVTEYLIPRPELS